MRAWTVVVHREWTHPGRVFTQGLSTAFGTLWESVGLYGESCLRELSPSGHRPRWTGALPASLFGEGIFPASGGIWQLTWKEGVAVRWDAATRAITAEVPYEREGWGACRSPLGAVTSDGGHQLVVRDPDTLRPARTIEVRADGHPIVGLNDLEWSGDRIWANLYGMDCFVGIDPHDGAVRDVVDARVLRARCGAPPTDVLNGIAATPGGTFYVTGKCWPTLFEVSFAPSTAGPRALLDLPETRSRPPGGPPRPASGPGSPAGVGRRAGGTGRS